MAQAARVDLFQHMTTFVQIADSGSISKGARSLRLSVAMASRHLKALEAHLGVDLMRRTTRHLTLTEAGAEYLARSRAILAGVHEAREELRPGAGPVGLVVMSLPVSFSFSQVRLLFPALLEQNPRLRLDLRFEDRIVDLLGDGVDLAVRAGTPPPDSPFVVARRLTALHRVLCASPAFVAKHGPIRTVEALAAIPCVVQGHGFRWTFETSMGSTMVVVDGRLRTNSIFAARDGALSGMGVARLPRWVIEPDLKAKRLVRVLESAVMPDIALYGIFHRGAKSSAAIRTILDYLEKELPRSIKHCSM